MKSNVCKIEHGGFDLEAILSETDKVARYCALSPKHSLYLRLLSEELVSMLPALVRTFSGEFYLETNGNVVDLNVRLSVEGMSIDTRDELIKISKDGKNASAKGITGKICAIFDYMALGGEECDTISPTARYGMATNVDFTCMWSLRNYKENLEKDEEEPWDELERSIIARLSDDVIVGVRGKKVSVTIRKIFKEEEK